MTLCLCEAEIWLSLVGMIQSIPQCLAQLITIDKEIRSKEHPRGKRTVEKPVAVERYNRNMAGAGSF